MSENYVTVTETPGIGATREQIARLYTRYKFAATFCGGKEVLEVACGAGQGLGYLARVAKRVVGGDIEERNLQFARAHYQGRGNIELRKIDAHDLPFEDHSFDRVILYEAIYYLDYPDKFLKECRRVLRERGVVLICTVNREWSDFNPSPFSKRYFSAMELKALLEGQGFHVELLGSCPVSRDSAKDRLISYLKRTAVALHLMPKTMKGKEFLKKLFFGKLAPLPPEVVDGLTDYVPPHPISPVSPVSDYKVLYAIGRLG